jgi:DNA-binding CsgD family transcriptional regulator
LPKFGHIIQAKKDLSPREQQVLDLLAAGLIYREIAVKLNIGEETVRSYVKHICRKLHVRNRIEAIANYLQVPRMKNLTAKSLGLRIRGKKLNHTIRT